MNMRNIIIATAAMLCSLTATAQDRADRQQLSDPNSFSMILLGDPQGYVKYDINQPIFELTTAWCADNIDNLNIKAVLCTGDLVEQNVACWLMEPVGSDPMYPKFGSHLWEMIGTPITDGTEGTVKSEVRRVVSAYKTYQDYLRDQYARSAVADAGAWNPEDVVRSVLTPRVSAVADTVRVVVNLTTEAGDEVTVDQTV